MSGGTPTTGVPGGSTPRWMRILIAGGVVLAVLLLGASLGMALAQPRGGLANPPGGTVDVGFAQDMSVHHRQAVLMAGIARDRSADPVIRSLAFDIERTQLEQVGWMQGWLSLWNAPLLAPDGRYMTWMTDAAAHHGMPHADSTDGTDSADSDAGLAAMPGMASTAELNQLRAVEGVEFDVLFLQLMLRHHEGGLPMAEYAAQHAETVQVRNLAGKMVVSQTNESRYLAGLITERGAERLPPPF